MSELRATTLLLEGDTTLSWTEEMDDQWVEFFEKKMAEGYIFFIVEQRDFVRNALFGPKKTEMENAEDALKTRMVTIPDGDMQRMLESGAGVPAKSVDETKMVRRTKDPKEAAKKQTVGHRARQGG
jgi:hypothetical protein